MLGENILKLRKRQGLSQEQLGELANVTRQTISNWELNETTPNPGQLKLLSKALNVSIDELLDNDVKNVLVEKVSNTEKLAGMIIKILKLAGIVFIIYVVLIVIAIISFQFIGSSKASNIEQVEMECSINENDYMISIGSDGYFNCSNCPKQMQKEIKQSYIDFSNISKTSENINNYFKSQNGFCE